MHASSWASVGSFLALVSLAPSALADDEPTAPLPPPAQAAPAAIPSAPPPAERADASPKARDYTVPMMVTDLALVGAFAGSFTLGRAGTLSPGGARTGEIATFAGFVGSGALYHEAFDLRSKTALSIVVRTLAPAVFSFSTWGWVYGDENGKCKKRGISEGSCGHDGAEVGAVVGAVIGMLGATVVEATILGPDGRKPPPPPKTGLSFAPSVAVQGGGAQLGLTGRF